jgi:uncharacterized RDD family membrane protein YckC
MKSENLYQSPKSDLNDLEIIQSVEDIKASKGIRFFTYVIDIILIYAMIFILGIFMYIFLRESETEKYLDKIPDILFGYMAMIIYYFPQEALFGRTLAKVILGTKVVDSHGNKVGPLKSLGRTFSRLIPFEAFSFLGDEGRRRHDSLTSTYVIKFR